MRAWAGCGAAGLRAKVAHCSFQRKALIGSQGTSLVNRVASASPPSRREGESKVEAQTESLATIRSSSLEINNQAPLRTQVFSPRAAFNYGALHAR